MYYVTTTTYVGPNPAQHVDEDKVIVRTVPQLNTDGYVCTDGWCGTWYDWAVHAYGEYETLPEAEAAIAEKIGAVRAIDWADWSEEGIEDETLVYMYKIGKYAAVGPKATRDYCAEGVWQDIKSDTTDEQIAEYVAEYQSDARMDGYELDEDALTKMMEKRRKELKYDEEDEDAQAWISEQEEASKC